MTNIVLELGDDVASQFPQALVAGLLIERLDVAATRLGDVGKHTQAACEALVASNLTISNLTDDPRITGWRDAIGRCGLKAGTYKSSVEQLARRFLKGGSISTALPVVNLYCAISTRYLAPLGGYDVGLLPEATIALRMGRPSSDSFLPLGVRSDDMPIKPTIPVYASGAAVLCWAFNHRDSRATCLSTETTTAAFISEAVTVEQRDGLKAALSGLSRELEWRGARPGAVAVVDANDRRVVLSV